MAVKAKPSIRKTDTVRDRAKKASNSSAKPRKMKRAARGLSKPFRTLSALHKKEYYLPMPDNRAGRFLNKRRSLVPKYFKNSWQELRQVNWPSRKETWKLTLAVFMFAVIFGLLVAVTDYALDKIFRKVLL